MADNQYTKPTLTNYNANPPSDDGSQTASNEVQWSKHKDKLGDPLKSFSESQNDNTSAAFAKTINTDANQNNAIAGSLAFTSSELTIATGSVAAVRSQHTIDTQNGDAADDLDTITVAGVSDGCVLYLRLENAARVVTLKDNTGNIQTKNNEDIILDANIPTVLLRVGTDWFEVQRPVVDNPFDQDLNTTDSVVFAEVDAILGANTPTAATVTTLVANTSVSTDTISEKTSAAGVTIDSVLVKDGNVAGTLDGVLGGNTPAAANVTTLEASGIANLTAAGARFGTNAAENTIDDYETLTWTPTVEGGGTPGTYTVTTGSTAKYVKDGSRVTVWARIAFSAASGGTGGLLISGFPFNYASASIPSGALNTRNLNLTNANPATTFLEATSGGASDVFVGKESVDNGAGVDIPITGVSTSTILWVNFSYFTDL